MDPLRNARMKHSLDILGIHPNCLILVFDVHIYLL